MKELLGDRERDGTAVPDRDQLEHHVHRRGPARAGQDVGVPAVEGFADPDIGELLRQLPLHLPVDCRAPVPKQAGAGEDQRPVADRPDHPALPAQTAKPGEQGPAPQGLDAEAGDHDRQVRRRGLRHPERRLDRETVAGGDGAGLLTDHTPGIAVGSQQSVDGPERLQGGAQGHHGEAGNDQERHPIRAGPVSVTVRIVLHPHSLAGHDPWPRREAELRGSTTDAAGGAVGRGQACSSSISCSCDGKAWYIQVSDIALPSWRRYIRRSIGASVWSGGPMSRSKLARQRSVVAMG